MPSTEDQEQEQESGPPTGWPLAGAGLDHHDSCRHSLTLDEVEEEDIGPVARGVEIPAMETSALRLLMLREPLPNLDSACHKELERWYIDGFAEALMCGDGYYLKVCKSSSGIPVGLGGWTVESNSPEKEPRRGLARRRARDDEHAARYRRTWFPAAVKRERHRLISEMLKQERQRIISNLGHVCCVDYMAVHPLFQNRGVGSWLLKEICDYADVHEYPAYVLTPKPEASFFTRFGFYNVTIFDSEVGSLVSMIRYPPAVSMVET